MSGTMIQSLVEKVLPLARTKDRPRFILLANDGQSDYDSGGGPPDWTPTWSRDENGNFTTPIPAGWTLMPFPMDVYGKRVGYFFAVLPEEEVGLWSGLATELYRVESGRLANEYEVSDLAEAIVRNHEEINLLLGMPKIINFGLSTPDFWGRGLQQGAVAVKAKRAFAAMCLDGGKKFRLVVALEDGVITTRFEPEEEGIAAVHPDLGYEAEVGLTATAIQEARVITQNEIAGEKSTLAPFEKKARSILIVPLVSQAIGASKTQGSVLGAMIFFDRMDGPKAGDTSFRSGDIKMVELLASQMATMMGNRQLADYRKEINLAGNLQQSLLPAHNPKIAGFDLAGRCVPARFVGGDYYDYLNLSAGYTGTVILDVSGHNLASALMMPMAQAALQWAGKRENDPAKIIAQASSILFGNLTSAELFLTLFLVVIKAGESQVRVANGGHNPPLFFHQKTGEVDWIDVDGPLVGLVPEPEHDLATLAMETGDILLLYTDGITETTDDSGEMFGEERLGATIKDLAAGSAQEILEGLYKKVWDFGDTGQDDVTVVVIRKT